MSPGRERRWSPSLIRVARTSWERRRSVRAERDPPRDVGVGEAVEEADRAVDRDLAAEQLQRFAALPESAGSDGGRLAVGRRLLEPAGLEDRWLSGLGREAPVREVWRRRDPDQRRGSARAGRARRAASASRPSRSRAARSAPGNARRSAPALPPASWRERAVGEQARALAAAGIVEQQAGDVPGLRPVEQGRPPCCRPCRTCSRAGRRALGRAPRGGGRRGGGRGRRRGSSAPPRTVPQGAGDALAPRILAESAENRLPSSRPVSALRIASLARSGEGKSGCSISDQSPL